MSAIDLAEAEGGAALVGDSPGVGGTLGRLVVSSRRMWCGCGSKLNHWGTAGYSPCFHLPGFHFGYLFLTHSHVSWHSCSALHKPLLALRRVRYSDIGSKCEGLWQSARRPALDRRALPASACCSYYELTVASPLKLGIIRRYPLRNARSEQTPPGLYRTLCLVYLQCQEGQP